MRRRFEGFLSAVTGVLLITGGPVDGAPRMGAWEPIFRGVELAAVSADEPRRMRGHALRIDLRAPGIECVATPSNGERPGETDGLRTSSFLKKLGLQAAINAAPFDIVHREEGQPQDVRGLLVTRGDVVSRAGRLPALVMTRDRRVRIAESPVETAGAWTGVGGFSVVLRKGKLTQRGDRNIHPRTAAGISRDGRRLFLLVIDGRQPGHSAGATTAEVGEWLSFLGAWDGINLDGGGTTTMVVAGPGGRAEIVNRPVHAGLPGFERVAGCHLGIRALPLSSPAAGSEAAREGG